MLSVVAAVLSSDPKNNLEILKVLAINPEIHKVRKKSYLMLDQLSGCAPQEWHYFSIAIGISFFPINMNKLDIVPAINYCQLSYAAGRRKIRFNRSDIHEDAQHT
jgi:hypothetical protein